MSVAQIMGRRSNMVQIDPVPVTTWVHKNADGTKETRSSLTHGMNTRCGRRHAHTTARIRVRGTGKGGKRGSPIWAELRIVMHRELPPGYVKWAWIQITRVGLNTRYNLYLTIESAQFPHRVAPTTGTVAVDIGWRNMPDGSIRVGYAVGTDGVEKDFRVDDRGTFKIKDHTHSLVDSLKYPKELRSVSDKIFGSTIEKLMEWLRAHDEERKLFDEHLKQKDAKRQAERNEKRRKDGEPEEPLTVRSALQQISAWKKRGPLAVLVRWFVERVFPDRTTVQVLWETWREERLSKRMDVFCDLQELDGWFSEGHPIRTMAFWLELCRHKDAHLVNWEGEQRRKALMRRRELYRHWANKLASQYEKVVVEDFDMRGVIRNAKPEEDEEGDNNAFGRQMISPSQFRNIILEAFGPSRRAEEDPADTTRCCTRCGHVDDTIDARSDVFVKCPACPAGTDREDQDRRAAINLLRWHQHGRTGEAARRAAVRAAERAKRKTADLARKARHGAEVEREAERIRGIEATAAKERNDARASDELGPPVNAPSMVTIKRARSKQKKKGACVPEKAMAK